MPRQKNAHGQYFTPPALAALMVTMLSAQNDAPVLEPSSGEGVFLSALDDAGYTDTTGVEIDASLVAKSLRPLINQSFVSWVPPREYDAVIGNPPYIRWRDLADADRAEVMAHRLYGTLFNSLSDYLTVFIALGVEALRPGGELVFVTPGFWTDTTHSAPLREWLLERGSITDVVDFAEASVFPGVSSAIIVFRFVKHPPAPVERVRYHSYVGPRRIPTNTLALADADLFVEKSIPPFTAGEHWTLATEDELAAALALEDVCRPTPADDVSRLRPFVDIANGMVSGLDAAFRVPDELVDELTPLERDATLRVLKAFQCTTFLSPDTSTYVDIPEGLSEDQALRDYPSLMARLTPHRDQLEKRYAYTPDLPYWEWSFKRSRHFFENNKQKGFVPSKERLTCRPTARFSLSDSDVVATQDMTAFAPKPGVRESLSYIVAYLNQPAVSEWIRRRGTLKGGVAEFSERPLANIPFRAIDWDNQSEVAAHDAITKLIQGFAGATNDERHQLELQVVEEFATLLSGTR